MRACPACGKELREGARFCDGCGAALASRESVAEYKQVTVLFADVVHSMDIASSVDTERLREIMADLVDRCAAVVRRYGGMIDKFTGDGVMALFGAPIALEDHAIRACMAAAGIQHEAGALAALVKRRDGVDLILRIGLNSGRVIAGDIGTSTVNYTAIGHQVGLAQRMESIAPAGGIMLSDTTARLVEQQVSLSEPEAVWIKGFDDPVFARRLLGVPQRARAIGRRSTFIGRDEEMAAVTALIDRANSGGGGCVVAVVGEPGIGKSRLVAEAADIAKSEGLEVFSTFCESHASDISFHVVSRLFRSVFSVGGLDDAAARARIEATLTDANQIDLVLLEELLGIGQGGSLVADIDPDARRRRLARLVSQSALAHTEPALYIVEDVHWIDHVSDAMLADFLAVLPAAQSTVLVTFRPEYRGPLARIVGVETIALAPLADDQIGVLTGELLGDDPSVTVLTDRVVKRAAGNPFFAEEIVRDLVERDVLEGRAGQYTRGVTSSDFAVPATLQATISARIDRLDHRAKSILSAAAVIGARFREDLVAKLLDQRPDDAGLSALIDAELIDPVSLAPRAEFAFRHPLIRTVAYEAQLRSSRAILHRRLATAIERDEPALTEENAALIAEHLEAAGDLHAAFGWHLRAAAWLTNRDLGAARTSWQRARQVADRLPADDPGRIPMQIIPRSLLCASTWRIGGTVEGAGFEELRELCVIAGDKRSLAIGMSGHVMELTVHNRHHESAELATECAELLEAIGDPELTVGLLYATVYAKYEAGEMLEGVRLTQRVIDLADGDPTMGNLVTGSPLAMAISLRGLVGCCVGRRGWRQDFDTAIEMARDFDPSTRVLVVAFKYVFPIPNGVLLPDADARRETAEALQTAEELGDDFVLGFARLAHGATLVQGLGPDRDVGFDLLDDVRQTTAREGFALTAMPVVDVGIARDLLKAGHVDDAIDASRQLIDHMFDTGEMIWHGPAITVFVEALLRRGAHRDVQEAQAAINRLAAVPVDPGFVLHELPLLRLRALLANAKNDDASYRDLRDRYRKMAEDLGFEGHLALANSML